MIKYWKGLYCFIYNSGFELTQQKSLLSYLQVCQSKCKTQPYNRLFLDVWVCRNADKYSNNSIVVVSVPVSLYAFQWHCHSTLDACVKASRLSDLSLSTWWSTVGTMWTNIAQVLLLLLFLHWATFVSVFTAGITSLLILYYLGVNWAYW